jgi:hypothetical protein
MMTVDDFYGVLALNAAKYPIYTKDEEPFYDNSLFRLKQKPLSKFQQLIKKRKALRAPKRE